MPRRALVETLKTMSAELLTPPVVEVPMAGRQLSLDQVVSDPILVGPIRAVLNNSGGRGSRGEARRAPAGDHRWRSGGRVARIAREHRRPAPILMRSCDAKRTTCVTSRSQPPEEPLPRRQQRRARAASDAP